MHVYLTLFGLVTILFFAATGFMLNHEDWFLPSEPRVRTMEGKLDAATLHSVDKFIVSENLRRVFGIAGFVNTFRDDENSIEVEFIRPSERTVAEINRETGETQITFESRGWAGLITDLHKGKSAGSVWGWVIDIVCILLVIICTTGLVLWSSLKSRGKWGTVAMLLGLGSVIAVFYWAVP
jgi:hypothetical protein